MLRKMFFTAFMILCSVGASCSFAFAETELVPDDSFEMVVTSSNTGFTSQKHLEVEVSTTSYPFTVVDWIQGGSNLVSNSVYLYSTNAATYYLDRCAYNYNAYSMPDFFLTFENLVIGLDMSDQVDGYYRYECDFYFGMGADLSFVQNAPSGSVFNFKPSYTYSSAPVSISDSESSMHCTVYLVGETDYRITKGSSFIDFGLVHFHMVSTFYFDSQYGSEVAFNLEPALDTMLGSLNFDCSSCRSSGSSSSVYFYYNNRVTSKLFANVDPPVTPTPTPTPYPGQDTQESIQQDVSQIVNILDVSATPVPTPIGLDLDPTVFEPLESVTLPDLSDQDVVDTYSNLWDIFSSLWQYLGILFGAVALVSVFCFVIGGRWL